jgi:ELWxxDGT repeat protein
MECQMPAKRILSAALALLLVAAIPARATTPPTFTVIDSIRPGADSSYALDLARGAVLGDYLYFHANDGTTGDELWRTNGTTTELVKDINPGAGGSDAYYFTEFGSYLYFIADDGSTGDELWRTNGTEAGTTRVADINPVPGASSDPRNFTIFGDYLYFEADDGATGDEVWRTNGTTTEMVGDIDVGSGNSNPEAFTPFGDFLYFIADNGDQDYVWRTNGTVIEQVPFPDAGQYVNCDCYDTALVALGGRLFSTVYSEATGNEFAYLNEPTDVLPETNRDGGVNSAWAIALSALALVTLAAGVGLRRRAGAAQR